jgi:integrase
VKKDDDRREYGDGGISTIVEGEHYLLRWYEPDPATGKRHQRNRHFYGTRREARDEIRDVQRMVSEGKIQRQSSMTLAELADEYLAHVERATKKRTYYSYSDTLRKHILPKLGRIPVSKITPKHVKDVLVAKRKEPQPSKKKNPSKNEPVKYYSERTIEYIQVVVHAMFGYAIDLKYVEENPAELKKSFAINLIDPDDPDELDEDDEDDEVPIWTQDQFDGFHAAGKDDYFYPAHCICATTGKRRGEVLGIKWKVVDLNTGRVRIKMGVQRFPGEGIRPCSLKGVRKGKKTRNLKSSVSLGPEVLALLKKHWEQQQKIKEAMGDRYQDEGWVFCRPDGKPYDPKTCSTHFKKICAKAGLPENTTLHHLRHIFTTRLRDFYLKIKETAELLDHATVQPTQGYDHSTLEREKKVALILEDYIFPESPPTPSEK